MYTTLVLVYTTLWVTVHTGAQNFAHYLGVHCLVGYCTYWCTELCTLPWCTLPCGLLYILVHRTTLAYTTLVYTALWGTVHTGAQNFAHYLGVHCLVGYWCTELCTLPWCTLPCGLLYILVHRTTYLGVHYLVGYCTYWCTELCTLPWCRVGWCWYWSPGQQTDWELALDQEMIPSSLV